MIRRNIARIAVLATTLCVASPSLGAADQWNARTILTFSAPVKVPGAMLPAGTYVFELVNPTSSTDVVKIMDRESSKVYALTHAVPTVRPDPTEDVILLFSPMDKAAMPAIRGWYPAGGRHGHLFVYSSDEARSLADRTKSVVLSRDLDDTSREAGTIVMVGPGGTMSAWRQDTVTQREWDNWSEDRRESTTPMIADITRGQQVDIDDVEDHPEQYFGRTLSIDGKVDEVYGPHLFELDQPEWFQQEGDVLVFVPKGSLAAVREDDRVTVTGTLKRFLRSDVIREARWMQVDGILEENLDEVPVLVATRIVGGDDDRAMVVSADNARTRTSAGVLAPIRDIAILGGGDVALVGRMVALPAVTIHSIDRDNGFFVKSGNRNLFVMLDEPDRMQFRIGDAVMLDGVVLALPPHLAASLNMPTDANRTIYVYANRVKSGR